MISRPISDTAARRRELARRVTDHLAAHAALKATLLTGSVAAGRSWRPPVESG